MIDLAVIILTKDEKLHIGRCLEKLSPLSARQVFVVDCFSTDGTQQIAKVCGATVIEHKWPGNQAKQFNWALDNLDVRSNWILRLDADEWLSPELIEEIKAKISIVSDDVEGVVLKRRLYVNGKWLKHGIYPTRLLRLFRTGRARYGDDMEMDEHLAVNGRTVEFEHDFVDETLISLNDWRAKHLGYAKREAHMVVYGKVNPNKRVYYKLPRYFRAMAYFSLRYFFKLGILDGLTGLRWHFWQGLWYRWLVDKKIGELKRARRLASTVN